MCWPWEPALLGATLIEGAQVPQLMRKGSLERRHSFHVAAHQRARLDRIGPVEQRDDNLPAIGRDDGDEKLDGFCHSQSLPR